MPATRPDVRNIAIIAHVDHGKTTLVDGFLRQAGQFRTGEVVADCAMDSNDLERERGITILSKFTAITWKGTRINIVDTPGHADFGGEVERVLKMVDSVCLLVDAFEGPMPQTRFVTRKALALGLRPILVVNKVDRPGCDPEGSVDATFDLFCALGATDAQLDFPIVYASGREGWAAKDLKDERKDLAPLLDLIVEIVPPPAADVEAPLAMHVTTLDYDDYLGYVAIGRMESGRIKPGDRVLCAHRDGSREEFRVAKILGYQSLKRFELAEASAGDICAVTGMQDLTVGETITDILNPTILPLLEIEEPTVQDAVHVEQRSVRGQGGQVRHLPQPARPPVQGAEVERRAARRGDAVARHVRRARPRRAAPDGADRDHAPRGLRADGLAAAGHLQGGRRRREAGAVRRGRHRPRRGLLGRGHRGARPARRAHAGDGAGGRGAHAPRVPLPGARPHRLPVAVPDRHARHRHHATTTSRTTARTPAACARARTAC